MPHPEESEKAPVESYYSMVGDWFNDFEPTANINSRKKSIENGRLKITITRMDSAEEKAFYVEVGAFTYHITPRGVDNYITDEIKSAHGLRVPNSRANIYVDFAQGKEVAARDLVSWTNRIVTADLVFAFPYQPQGYASEGPRQT